MFPLIKVDAVTITGLALIVNFTVGMNPFMCVVVALAFGVVFRYRDTKAFRDHTFARVFRLGQGWGDLVARTSIFHSVPMWKMMLEFWKDHEAFWTPRDWQRMTTMSAWEETD